MGWPNRLLPSSAGADIVNVPLMRKAARLTMTGQPRVQKGNDWIILIAAPNSLGSPSARPFARHRQLVPSAMGCTLEPGTSEAQAAPLPRGMEVES